MTKRNNHTKRKKPVKIKYELRNTATTGGTTSLFNIDATTYNTWKSRSYVSSNYTYNVNAMYGMGVNPSLNTVSFMYVETTERNRAKYQIMLGFNFMPPMLQPTNSQIEQYWRSFITDNPNAETQFKARHGEET